MRAIPTAILTISQADAYVLRSNQLQPNVFLTKPVQVDALVSLVTSLTDSSSIKVRVVLRSDQ